MKTWICLVAVCLVSLTARAADYTGRYAGYYTISVEKVTVNGQAKPGGVISGITVAARVRDSGRVIIASKGNLRFNGRLTGEYIDEVFYGKVDRRGWITMSGGGFTPASMKAIYGKHTVLSKSASIRYGRMELKAMVRTQKFGLMNYQIVANKKR
jgi:hypothetical protein